MKKMKKTLLGVLALGCIALGACGGKDSYTVTLMDGNSVISTAEKDKSTHLDAPSAPTKDGYTFEGWYTDAALTTPYSPDLLSANLTLYAKYTPATFYISFRLNGGAFAEEILDVEVKYGQEYSLPTPTRDGYTFTGWTLDGEDFPATGTYQKTNAIRVAANWEMTKYTVQFKAGDEVLGSQDVEYGKTATAWNNPEAGYEVVGIYTDAEMTALYDFGAVVTEDLILYVKLQPKTFNIIVNLDGDPGVDTTAVYGQEYTIQTPERNGYIFKGFLYNDQPFAATGTYTYAHDITITVDWEKDEAFNKSTVSFYDGNKEISSLERIVENGTLLSNLIDAPTKKGYTFVGWYTDATLKTAFVDGTEIVADVALYAKYQANTYQLTVNLDGGEYDGESSLTISAVYGEEYNIPERPVKNGYEFAGYTVTVAGIISEFACSGTYVYAENIFVTAKWSVLKADEDEESAELFLNKGSYFKERAAADHAFDYVFVTGKEYKFSAFGSQVEIIGADDVIETTAETFLAKGAKENVTIRIVKDYNGTEYTFERNVRIVDQVMAFDYGADYLSVWGEGVDRGKNFLDAKASAVIGVGKDGYIPDLAILTSGGQKLTMEKAYVSIAVTVDGVATTDYVIENGKISFNQALVGAEVEITYKPKYALIDTSKTVKLQINEGVNVYTNTELKAAYANKEISQINILRNIKAEISASDYVPGTNNPINKYEYSVYTRSVANPADTITINGNFFKIDGSGLPYAHNGVDGRSWAVDGLSGYYVNNMQIGLFLYHCTDVNDKYIHNGQAIFNDLYLEANNTGDAAASVKYNDKDLLIYSGAYHGIVCRGGTINVNNTTIAKTNIAVFTESGDYADDMGGVSATDSTQQAVQVNLYKAKLINSWSNQIYFYNFTKLDIKESYLGVCGGGAIHSDDIAHPASATTMSSVITIDKATRIENYVTGDEAWFRGYGMALQAKTVKQGVEGGLMQVTAGAGDMLPNTTIIKKDNGVERMNLIFIVRSNADSSTSDWNADAQQVPYVELNVPVYIDLVKAMQGQGGINIDNIPNSEYQVFMPFNTRLVDPSVAPGAYMAGYVEVFNA